MANAEKRGAPRLSRTISESLGLRDEPVSEPLVAAKSRGAQALGRFTVTRATNLNFNMLWK